MTKQEKKQMKQWIKTWEKAGKALEEVRRQEIRKTNTQESISILGDVFEYALLNEKPKETSGLVELQSWLKRMKNHESSF